MNKVVNTVLLTGALGAALGLSAISWSMGPGQGRGFDVSHVVSRMADRLDMTAEQQAEIEAVLATAGGHADADRERLAELKQLLQAQVVDFSAGEAQMLADEFGEISARLRYGRTAAFAEAYRLLDEEQRKEMQEMLAEREARRGKWRRSSHAEPG